MAHNVFGLNPPQPAEAQPAETPLKITPNGIMSIFGQLQVLFKVAGVPKAGQPPKENSYILGEDQRQDDIEVIHIDEKASLVTFNNHGIVQEIPLANAPAVNTPMPAMGGAATTRSIPQPHTVGGRIPPYFGGGPVAGQNRGLGANNTGQESQIPMTPEQQVLMIEAQREYYKSQNDPLTKSKASLLPPTAMTPPDAFGPTGNPLVVPAAMPPPP